MKPNTLLLFTLAGAATAISTPPASTATAVAGKYGMTTACINVSVETDATYCIQGPICSGSGKALAGSLCPVKGALAVKDCNNKLSSWTSTGVCVAPSDAVCSRIKTGAWGCAYESTKSTNSTTNSTSVSAAPTPTPTAPTSGSNTANSTVVVAKSNTTSISTTPAVTPATTTTKSSNSTTNSTSPPSTTTASNSSSKNASCTDVSVEADASYCIQGSICSGSGATPAGLSCPVKGAVAARDCTNKLPSWTNTGLCVAPSDAVCSKIRSGAWGCVFGSTKPSNSTTNSTAAPNTNPIATPIAATSKPSNTTLSIPATTPATVTPTTTASPAKLTSSPASTTKPASTNATVASPTAKPTSTATTTSTTTTAKPPSTAPSSTVISSPANTTTGATSAAIKLAQSYAAADKGKPGVSDGTIAGGAAAAVAGVAAVAVFAVHKRRQNATKSESPGSAYHGAVPTPL